MSPRFSHTYKLVLINRAAVLATLGTICTFIAAWAGPLALLVALAGLIVFIVWSATHKGRYVL